jgi:hypothetical protein
MKEAGVGVKHPAVGWQSMQTDGLAFVLAELALATGKKTAQDVIVSGMKNVDDILYYLAPIRFSIACATFYRNGSGEQTRQRNVGTSVGPAHPLISHMNECFEQDAATQGMSD